MGMDRYCDFCGLSAATETALQPLKIGEQQVGEACFNCASRTRAQLSQLKTQTYASRHQGAGTPKQEQKQEVAVNG